MIRKFEVYLEDILDSINKIEEYVKEMNKDDFLENSLVFDAVCRNLEIIGEASSQISEEFKNENKNVS